VNSASGEELIILSGTIAITLAKCMDIKELVEFTELLGLVRHDLDIIKFRRFLKEKEQGKDGKDKP